MGRRGQSSHSSKGGSYGVSVKREQPLSEIAQGAHATFSAMGRDNLRINLSRTQDALASLITSQNATAPKPRLLQFNYAKTTPDKDRTLHFFIDDYQFERLWNKPERYLTLIKSFEAVLTPDFSLYMDMPLPMQQWNEYRRRALGNYWQRNGVTVIPTLSWSDERSYGFCFDGLPKNSTLATSTVGVKSSKDALAVWNAGMAEAMRRLKPKRLLLYGGNVGFDFGKCEVIEYDVTTKVGGRDGR